jgi:serine phosphatase RsbU (regulator of sigma subunit)
MKEIGDKQGIASSYNNIGIIYDYKGDYKEALKNYFASLKIKEEIGDKQGMASSNINIGEVNILIKNYTEARNHLNTALLLSTEIGSKEWVKDSYLALASLDTLLGNWKSAFMYYQRHSEIKDSIFNEDGTRSMAEMQTKYESEKKESEIKLLQKEKEVQGKNLEKQKTIRDAILVGLLLVIIFAVLMYNRFRLIRKQKNIIELKEKETQLQKEVIEEKHKEITDSINYAERIQRSLLASKEFLDENLNRGHAELVSASHETPKQVQGDNNNYFIFFKPKDIVSGDFYWASKLSNNHFALITADSTGHGVPGAIMSILNIACLNEAIKEGLCLPNEILNHTRTKIIDVLKRDGSKDGGKDGMDCSLIVLNKERTQLIFATANNPVFIIRNNELIEFKPDKMPVGKHDKDAESFSLQTVNLQKGDIIYTLTDGFSDQFGGENGKKYMIKTLKQLLLQIASLTMQEQQQKLAQEFTNWKGENEQVDDVCIMGVKI